MADRRPLPRVQGCISSIAERIEIEKCELRICHWRNPTSMGHFSIFNFQFSIFASRQGSTDKLDAAVPPGQLATLVRFSIDLGRCRNWNLLMLLSVKSRIRPSCLVTPVVAIFWLLGSQVSRAGALENYVKAPDASYNWK